MTVTRTCDNCDKEIPTGTDYYEITLAVNPAKGEYDVLQSEELCKDCALAGRTLRLKE